MQDPHDHVQRARAFLEEVDWETVETGMALGTTAAAILRRHPWLLVGAGAGLAAIGAWFVWDDSGRSHGAPSDRKALRAPPFHPDYTPAP